MNLLKTLMAILISAVTASVFAQSKDEKKYREASEEIRKQVWAWDKPQFKVRDVPAEYASASKVVLAQHTELTAESKSKFAFYVITFGVNKQQTITEVVREMIKLNDKTAVDDYSELSFTQFDKRSGFYSKDKTTQFIGVRVIKPSGTVKEIVADDIVLTKDEKKEKKAKVAIPDLQPGDIIDYFIATEQIVTNDFTTKSYSVILFDDAPILNLSFHGQLGKKYAVDYRSYNGAPELKVSKNEDDDIVIDVEKKNLPPLESSFWVAPARDLPFIRMFIGLGYKGPGSAAMDMKKPGEVNKDVSTEKALEGKSRSLSTDYYNYYWMKAARAQFREIEDDAKKRAKKMGIDYSSLSNDDKAALLFYTLRFSKLLSFDINKLDQSINIGKYEFNGFSFVLFCILKVAEIEPAILVSNTRAGYRMTELMGDEDLAISTYIPGAVNKFLSIYSVYDVPFTIPEGIEGVSDTRSCTFDHPGVIMSMSKMTGLTNMVKGPDVPVTKADQNAHIEKLALSLSEDKSSLLVKRSTTVKGNYKKDLQSKLILYEDFYESERKALGEEQSLVEQLEDSRKGRKIVDELTNAFADARKKQKDAFLDEAKDWFEQEVTNMKDCKTDSLGVRHTAPNFVYSSSFNLAGMIKKAGNNFIIEIGKIQGKPLTIKPDQRKRMVDIYMPFARTIEYNVELAIPDGYTAEGVEALAKKVETEVGSFVVEASNNGKAVNIKVRKQYLHGFEPVKNWDKLLAFIDAATDWSNAKLLLKKK